MILTIEKINGGDLWVVTSHSGGVTTHHAEIRLVSGSKEPYSLTERKTDWTFHFKTNTEVRDKLIELFPDDELQWWDNNGVRKVI